MLLDELCAGGKYLLLRRCNAETHHKIGRGIPRFFFLFMILRKGYLEVYLKQCRGNANR